MIVKNVHNLKHLQLLPNKHTLFLYSQELRAEKFPFLAMDTVLAQLLQGAKNEDMVRR